VKFSKVAFQKVLYLPGALPNCQKIYFTMAENQFRKISIHFNAFCGVLYSICGNATLAKFHEYAFINNNKRRGGVGE
jgi:hypothetical protein